MHRRHVVLSIAALLAALLAGVACTPRDPIVSAAVESSDADSGAIRGYLLEWVYRPSAKELHAQSLVATKDGTLYWIPGPQWRRPTAVDAKAMIGRLQPESGPERAAREEAIREAQTLLVAKYPYFSGVRPSVSAYLVTLTDKGGATRDVLVTPDAGSIQEGFVLERWPFQP